MSPFSRPKPECGPKLRTDPFVLFQRLGETPSQKDEKDDIFLTSLVKPLHLLTSIIDFRVYVSNLTLSVSNLPSM